MTVIQKKADNPIAHLSAEDIEIIGKELDAIRDRVLADRGERDARYIRKVIKTQRTLEISSRAVLLFSLFPPAWIVGTAGLTVAKILDNMEIGHNVLHGQWDWMRDPKIHSTTWEWDHVSPADQWKQSHNELHHRFTNVVGKDNDLGYGIMRVDEDQPWHPMHLGQPVWNLLNACFFEYGIAAYDMELGDHLKQKRLKDPAFRAKARAVGRKIRRQVLKDYVVHPLLSGPSFLSTLAATFTANLLRNVWSHSVIMCGHFPNGVETFEKTSIEGETRGEWYLRQMLGSANISGPRLLHLMTGNLSFQIEHHLFPDLPSNRYQEIAPQVRALFDRYGLRYTTGPLPKQVASAWWKVIRLSLPNRRDRRQPAAPGPLVASGAV
ncbi:linoleoyl-CoA desaturase [Micromonospora sediminicola]|uniref:Linoleoyl-CoA desaturase n=1 Tax=Micromonospora sediminicola TaxID=946078 RepID=A0A1A9BE99_9ACTN|nr:MULTISPECIES: acyl-CoA desaturase [Micromonospora]PGH45313.1 acyl-CoA desaturase [Micromonospora sp. WMMA1996]SBT67197.1 linoleoyl-CoA desaturase [Micromonospora sediminicola]